jgi:hypothetical protein
LKILLDKSPSQITEWSKRHKFEFWQLRTPLTKYAIGDKPYGLDNGCFSQFKEKTWYRMLDDARPHRPIFVCLPDIVGDAVRTLDLFDSFKAKTNRLPRALVLQDGIGNHRIPWEDIAAVFVGGTDPFKTSTEAFNACKAAKMLGKWVHVGRVNTAKRTEDWIGIADSIDGSGISQYDWMVRDVLNAIRGTHPQRRMFI